MKKSIFSDEISQDLSEAIGLAVKYDIEALELRNVWNKTIVEASTSELGEIKKRMEESNLSVSCIATFAFKCRYDSDSEFQESMDIIKRGLEAAQFLNARVLRVFTFWKPNFEVSLEELAEKMRPAVELFRNTNVILGIENGSRATVGSTRDIGALIDIINEPFVGVVWDPGNCLFGERERDPFPEGYSHIRGKVVHLHIKDVKVTSEGPRYVELGKGDIDFREILKQLKRDGFEGYASIETHWRPNFHFTRQELDLPYAHISREGYEASEIYLSKFQEMWPGA